MVLLLFSDTWREFTHAAATWIEVMRIWANKSSADKSVIRLVDPCL